MRIKPRSPREALQPDTPPAPPSRSRHVRNPIVILINLLLTLAMGLVVVVGVGLYWGKTLFDAKGPLTKEQTVIITSGSGLSDIAHSLQANGVIEDGWYNAQVFALGVRIYKNGTRLKAGEYAFEPATSMHGVMNALVSGKAVVHSVTIPEGWTSAQVVQRLQDTPLLSGSIEKVPPEGSLLPETYSFTRGMNRQKILDEMAAAQKRTLAEIWSHRAQDLPIKTPQELVTLASIVEKETGKADERPRIAGVFVNRLEKNMPLQSDPTIIYGLYGGDAWTKDRSAITRSDMNKQTPYNTYQNKGLPPGPIGNPGRASMEAVANPSRTKELYFVADGTGGHIFADTYAEHQHNVRKWRAVERKERAEEQQSKSDDDASSDEPTGKASGSDKAAGEKSGK